MWTVSYLWVYPCKFEHKCRGFHIHLRCKRLHLSNLHIRLVHCTKLSKVRKLHLHIQTIFREQKIFSESILHSKVEFIADYTKINKLFFKISTFRSTYTGLMNPFQKLATSAEHVVYQNCAECQNKNNNLCTQHVLKVFWG